MVVHSVLALVRSHDPATVPTTIPSNTSHSLDTRATKLGPVNNCQMLVTNDGTISSEAAVTGGMTAPRTPMATVGRPIPVTPLTMPAKKKTTAIISTCDEEKSIILTQSRTVEHFEQGVAWPVVPLIWEVGVSHRSHNSV